MPMKPVECSGEWEVRICNTSSLHHGQNGLGVNEKLTHVTDEKFNIIPVVVEPTGAIPQGQVETDHNACGMNEVPKVELVIIFEGSVVFQPPYLKTHCNSHSQSPASNRPSCTFHWTLVLPTGLRDCQYNDQKSHEERTIVHEGIYLPIFGKARKCFLDFGKQLEPQMTFVKKFDDHPAQTSIFVQRFA